MIQIIQAGQAGKTKYLLDMHRLRARIFKERMGWDVNVDMQGLEVDDFDIPSAVYLLSLDDAENVVGSWRILPTAGPTMIRQVWPSFAQEINMRSSGLCWEMSRFGIHTGRESSLKEGLRALNNITAEMFCALTELCILCDIEEIYTLYDHRIEKILGRIDCHPVRKTAPIKIDGIDSFVGIFIPDRAMLSRIRVASGIHHPLISPGDLPPLLRKNSSYQVFFTEEDYAGQKKYLQNK